MSKTPNGFGSITHSKRGGRKYWTGRITLGYDAEGNQIRKSFSSYSKSEVLEKMKDAIIKSSGTISGTVESGNQTLTELIYRWLFHVKALEVRPSTVARYETILKHRISPYPYGNIKVRDINVLNLQAFINFLIEAGWSHNSVKDTLSLMRTFLKYTVAIGIHPSSPGDHVKVPKKNVKTSSSKFRVFTQEEQDLILGSLDLEDPIEQMIYLCFFTGLRRNELRGLQWRDYDKDTLHIRRQYGRDYVVHKNSITQNPDTFHDLKTENSERDLPIPGILQEFLDKLYPKVMAKHLRVGKRFTQEATIFSDDLCHPIDEKRPNRRLQKLCKEVGIPPRPLHSIRHSYATRLFEQGVEIKTVQMLLGHSDYETTVNIYTHVMPKHKENAVSAFDKMYQARNF